MYYSDASKKNEKKVKYRIVKYRTAKIILKKQVLLSVCFRTHFTNANKNYGKYNCHIMTGGSFHK